MAPDNSHDALQAEQIRVPVYCTRCSARSVLENPRLVILQALDSASTLGALRRELLLLHRTRDLFDRFPSSRDATRVLRCEPWGAETEPDPIFQTALDADPELKRFLNTTMFRFPARLSLIENEVKRIESVLDRSGIACAVCREGVLEVQEEFLREFRARTLARAGRELDVRPRTLFSGRKEKSFGAAGYRCVLHSHPWALGPVKYLYTMSVFKQGQKRPCLVVASELNRLARTLGGPSHFLGLFTGNTHMNLGPSDEWADIGKFTDKALHVVRETLGIPVELVEESMRARRREP